ncbi:MAG: hypothetical protein JST86_07125 [Bacteroidetes bacterium]|nr:hypothetical protein [Bacteroidota bacterium]
MNTSSKLIGTYIKIWPVASFINALLSVCFIGHGWNGAIAADFILAFIFSVVLSIPVLIAAIIVSSILSACKIIHDDFLQVLIVVFICSAVAAFLYRDFLSEIDRNPVPLCISIVISSLLAAIIFRQPLLKSPPEDYDDSDGSLLHNIDQL